MGSFGSAALVPSTSPTMVIRASTSTVSAPYYIRKAVGATGVCGELSPSIAAGGDGGVPGALITAEVDVAPQIPSQFQGQGQQWVLKRPGAFTSGDPRAGKA